MLSKFFKDSIVYTFSGFLTRGISFLLLPLYTRILSPAEYGAFDLLLAFGTLVNVTVALEIAQALARFYNDQTEQSLRRAYAGTALLLTLLMYVFFSIGAITYAKILTPVIMGKNVYHAAFIVGIFSLWGTGVFNVLQNILRADLQSKTYALNAILVAIGTALLSVLFAYVFHGGLPGVLLAMALGSGMGILNAVWRLRDALDWRLNKEILKKMLRFSLPLVPSSIAVIVAYYIDRVMIRHFLTLEDVGVYGIAFRVSNIVSFLIAGFQVALVPLIYKHHHEESTPQHLEKIFRFFMGFGFILFVGLSLFAPEILWVMTTPDYYRAAPIIMFLTPAILLSNMYIFAPGTGIKNATITIMWINIAGAVLNILLNVLLIPRFGIIGACMATLINYACVFLLYLISGHKHYPVHYPWKRLGSMAGIAIAFVWVGAQLEGSLFVNIVTKLFLVGLIPVAYYFCGLITNEELAIVKRRLKAQFKAS